MSEAQEQRVTKYRDEAGNAATLQQYAHKKRQEQTFNDVVILAESENIPANKLVLSCYSKFFESMFLLPVKEQHQKQVEIQQFDGKIVRALIDYMYSGEIEIDAYNVKDVLAAADFFQMLDVKQFCCEVMECTVTDANCIEILKTAAKYQVSSCLKTTYQVIGENWYQLASTETFQNLSKDELTCLLVNFIYY